MGIRGYPEIGWPRLKMADGPLGVRNFGPSTADPAGIGLAATWDPALAKSIGEGFGRDARARSFCEVSSHAWKQEPGKFMVFVDHSSADIDLTADYIVAP